MITTERRGPRWMISPHLRLRQEAWGGVAFDKANGNLLEFDSSGFAVLSALTAPRDIRSIRDLLSGDDSAHDSTKIRLPELADFLKMLEVERLIDRIDAKVVRDSVMVPVKTKRHKVSSSWGRLSAPIVAHWAVTYRCNLACPFCYAGSNPQREKEPPLATRIRIIERLAAWGIFEIAIGGGEPMVLRDLPEVLAAIRQNGMVPNMTTNGTIPVTDAVLRAVAENVGVVHFSFDQPRLLDLARGNGTFERIRQMANRLQRGGIRIGGNLLLTPANAKSVQRSLETAIDLGLSQVTLLAPKGEWARTRWAHFPNQDDLPALKSGVLSFLGSNPAIRLYVDTALREEWRRLGLLTDFEPEVVGCGGGQHHVALTPDGDVYPCSHARRAEFKLGNLLTGDFPKWANGKTTARNISRFLARCRGYRCACRSNSCENGPDL